MKTQMRFQKILSLASLILAAVTCVVAFLYCGGIIGASRSYTTAIMKYDIDGNPVNDPIKADALYAYVQKANNTLVIMAIIFVVAIVMLYLFACNSRRNYYITNYIAIGVVALYAVVFAIIGISIVIKCMILASQIDIEAWKGFVNTVDDYSGEYAYIQDFSTSYLPMIIGMLVYLVVLADAAAWIYNLIWKTKLMQGEKALLAQGLNKEVA